MVLVFHINRRLIQYKSLILISVFLVLIFFIHTFEVTYHLLNGCPYEEPIDVVYTWVNGSDPRFLKQLNSCLHEHSNTQFDSSSQRYDDKDELKFSLRSLEKYAPWISHVYIVTNGQIPFWLNLDYEKVTVITHKEIFADKYNLPTFSSPAIEAHLHRIPGLSKRFIYFNDDVFLRSPIYKDDFISPSRGFLIYLAWLMPMCSLECSWLYVADGHCDNACNNPSCQMDGGDCNDTKKAVLGDVIVKFDDYEDNELKQSNYEKILASLQNQSVSSDLSIVRHLQQNNNVSGLIEAHNKNIILLDKLRRRNIRKRQSMEYYYLNRMQNQNRNIDAYAASLQHTNRLLNQYYGFSVRKVPAHAPIMIDRDIMEKMQKKFARQFEVTARNRVRSVDDIQFAFSYYYYVIHEKIDLSIEQIFDQFDTDHSGIWSETELRTVITKLYELPVKDEAIDQFTTILINCSKYSPLPNLIITKELVTSCPHLSSFIKLNLAFKHKYKFEIIKDAEKRYVSFKMLNSNATEVLNQLDDIRKNAKKFACLNDNLDQIRTFDNQIIQRLLFEFYVSLFPLPSKFELPEHYKNRFSHMEDYVIMLKNRQRKFLFGCVCLMLMVFIVFLNIFKRRICTLVNEIFC